jgi:acyl carrier protein
MSDALRGEILATLTTIVRQQLRSPDIVITEASTTRDIPGWDSLTHVGIIVATEKAFQFRMRSTEMAKMVNVGSLIDIVLARGKLQGLQ